MTALTLSALTVRQPWASLIALGVKRYETRGWRPRSLGPDRLLAIHAATAVGDDGPAWNALGAQKDLRPLSETFGCVLCVVEVEDVLPSLGVVGGQARLGLATEGSPDGYRVLSPEETALGDYKPGRCAWRLRVVERFAEPIPARGALNLWRWTRPGAAGEAK